jgi:hypothetical protein
MTVSSAVASTPRSKSSAISGGRASWDVCLAAIGLPVHSAANAGAVECGDVPGRELKRRELVKFAM